MTRLMEIGFGDEDSVTVFTDLFWNEPEKCLYSRSVQLGLLDPKTHRYYFQPDEKEPLIGDATTDKDIQIIETMQKAGESKMKITGHLFWGAWKPISDDKLLRTWQVCSQRYPDRRLRATEFLKAVNFDTYQEQECRLKELEPFEKDDRKKIAGIYKGKNEIVVNQKMFSPEPFYIRETERNLRRETKNELEKWFLAHGIDPTLIEVHQTLRAERRNSKFSSKSKERPQMSQNETLVKHFNEGKSLTTRECFKLFEITRLAARCWEINRNPKRYGIRIGAKPVRSNGKNFVRYWKVATFEMNKGGL